MEVEVKIWGIIKDDLPGLIVSIEKHVE